MMEKRPSIININILDQKYTNTVQRVAPGQVGCVCVCSSDD